jgi:hypothetical protein
MKIKSLSILTIGALLLCAPLLAQTEEPDPYGDPPPYEEEAQESQDVGTDVQDEESMATEDESLANEDESLAGEDEGLFDNDETDEELPRTAGPLPLLALLGLGALSSALGLRTFRRRK